MDSQKADVATSVVRRSIPGRGWWAFALVMAGVWWAWDRSVPTVREPASANPRSLVEWNAPPAPEAVAAGRISSGQASAGHELADENREVISSGKAVPEAAPEVMAPEQRVLGVWRDFYRGERTLTLNPDGSGTMVVKLGGVAKKLFAETLQFDLVWEFEEGRLVMSTVDGRPASKFELIRKLYGDRADYEVLELTADQMRLRDFGGKTEYDWRRPEKLYEDVALDDLGSL